MFEVYGHLQVYAMALRALNRLPETKSNVRNKETFLVRALVKQSNIFYLYRDLLNFFPLGEECRI